MIPRTARAKLIEMAGKFPVITITGPRQSGKTTLAKKLFAGHAYVSLEEPDNREFARTDPRGFLARYPNGVVIDEAQHVPSLFSYIQGIVDSSRRNGAFILTGSHNFLMMERMAQSLAGRAYVFNLLPLSRQELQAHKIEAGLPAIIFQGGYPRIYDRGIAPADFYPSYVQTYVERDVRSVLNVADLELFHAFLRMAAARVGQLFNASALGNELGLNYKTVQRWLSVLESSFILYRLPPWHRNLNKRTVRTPKVYFHDTGLLCHLLGITEEAQLASHFAYGQLFENFVLSELRKQAWNHGNPFPAYFWRDSAGNEIDLLLERGSLLQLIEIKSGTTIREGLFKPLKRFEQLAEPMHCRSSIIHGGSERYDRSGVQIIPWNDLNSVDQ